MNMKWSQRITAFAVLAVMVLCMSGYTTHVPIVLEKMGLRPARAIAEAEVEIGGEGNDDAFDNDGEYK